MSFLAPLFFLGTAAVVLPVLFHLIRRSSRERIPFSSLMFLLPSPPRVTKRSKLENVLLLLLRCLVIFFLAFAFARPFFSRPVAPDPSGRNGQKTLVLLDTSASMRRGNLWAEAKDQAKAVFRAATLADQIACITFDRVSRTRMGFEQWVALPASDRAALASKQLDEITPGWSSTRLGAALINACELFETSAKEEQSPKRIVLITDLQEGSRLDGLQGFEWPRGIDVGVHVLQAPHPSNAGLQLAPDQAESPSAEQGTRVRVVNAAGSQKEQFHLGWRGTNGSSYIGSTMDTYIPPGQSRVVTVPKPTNGPAPDRIVLEGDDEAFDNTVYVVPPKAAQSTILFLGNDQEKNPKQSLYYLRRAFQETRRLAVEIKATNLTAALSDADLAQIRLVIVNGLLSEDQVKQLRAYLDRDRAVLFTLTSASFAPALARLTGTESIAADEASGESYSMFGQIDFQHPLFAPFADPRYSDFTKIHFWKHRQASLDKIPGVRVLARFDNGDVALAEVPVGKGKVWVLTSGWQPDDSQLALSSKFVPLLYAMLDLSSGTGEAATQYSVGEPLMLPFDAESVTIRKPDASEEKVRRGDRFNGSEQPGIYQVSATQPIMSFAVNLPPEESRTAPLPLEELERLGVPLQRPVNATVKQVEQRREHLQAMQLENRQKLWRWLLVAALVVLVMETWLAGRLTRRAVPVTSDAR